jgi:hypothetical protein
MFPTRAAPVSLSMRTSFHFPHLFACVLMLAALSACDSGKGTRWTERDSAEVRIIESALPELEVPWRLAPEPETRIPLASFNGAPMSVFGDGDGRIFVGGAGEGSNQVLVHDATGKLVARIGEGGAGALARVEWAQPYRGDSVVVFDRTTPSLKLFAKDGAFGRDLPIPSWRREGPERIPGYAPGAIGAFEDGSFLTSSGGALDSHGPFETGPAWYRYDLLRVSRDGATSDTLGTFGIFEVFWDGGGPQNYPFGASSVAAPYEDGFLYGTGQGFEVGQYDATGKLVRILRRTYRQEPIIGGDLEDYAKWMMARMPGRETADSAYLADTELKLRQLHHPEFRPALSGLVVDDEDNVWLQEFRWVDPFSLPPETRPESWSVFDKKGRWITEVRVPAGFVIRSVSNGKVYGVQVDSAGTAGVRVYPLIKK